jgi:hypothetical protein
MKRVVLQFPTLHLLWTFVQTLTSHSAEINTSDRILICDCTEENIADAVAYFQARVVETIKPGTV